MSEAAAQGDLLVLVSGMSIELKALLGRLEGSGVRTQLLDEALNGDGSAALARLLLCDLATDGALPQLQRYYPRVTQPGPMLVTLGTPRSAPSELETAILANAVERYRRPLDVQAIADRVSSLLR